MMEDVNEEKNNITNEAKDTNEVSVWSEIFSFIKILVLFVFCVWFIHSFVVEGYEVWGPSMMNTLDEGDRILVFKLPCVLKNFPLLPEQWKIHEGDIVVFEGKDENDRRYVKRVIAMVPSQRFSNIANASENAQKEIPQKKVEYFKNKVYVNNHMLEENYLDPKLSMSDEEDLVFLHPGEYYVLGDNRKISKDSRFFGPVTEDQIVGKAIFRFWPLSKIGWL
ncbi:MAG TPA: signal peptidase I [Candidatus Hydrogenedens sp.]|nr:signal peptidase I [Candidatus Hydrogenedens sp.]HOK10335.1 signal peptidase I [Candidatus Hydrogenedens sp.]HOL20321.1 signal peptidase I [Candidatus Hydrogenedens sp.]HPP59838.1 signal peptidase I [Candidatus Hydrogenedens sp.]